MVYNVISQVVPRMEKQIVGTDAVKIPNDPQHIHRLAKKQILRQNMF